MAIENVAQMLPADAGGLGNAPLIPDDQRPKVFTKSIGFGRRHEFHTPECNLLVPQKQGRKVC